ncbi:MAG: ATP synthase F1 subunit epsilon [Opitutales bacterium]|nr:ATP synthase F1 subunit epsilon [Opitutales bacterium]
MPLTLEIVTPERKVLSETVEHVVLPSEHAGEIDILPGHIPLMTMMEPGELRYFKDGKPESIAVDKGFIRVYGDTVSVLTEAAIEVDKIDVKSLEEAQARAASAVAEAKLSDVDPAILEELETRARFAVIQKIISDKKR